jgi:hypothetical protein
MLSYQNSMIKNSYKKDMTFGYLSTALEQLKTLVGSPDYIKSNDLVVLLVRRIPKTVVTRSDPVTTCSRGDKCRFRHQM